MNFEAPTYEEYLKATAFARFKYKYGIVVTSVAVLCFIVVIWYMIYNGEAIASNPLIYGAEKYSVTCECRKLDGNSFLVNATNIWIPEKLYNFDGVNLSVIG